MATTSNLSSEQLLQKIKELKSQGKTESTSKSLGKYIDAYKTLNPGKYGAETVASAQKKLSTSTAQATKDVNNSSGNVSSTNYLGDFDLNKIYESAMNSSEIQALQKELEEKRRARITAETNVNDNPFYSEATRVGKLSKIAEKADREISTLEQALAERKADAQIKTNIALQQYNIENKKYQDNLQKLNMLISSGAITGASPTDLTKIAVATGLSTGMLKSIVESTKNKDKKIQLTTNDDGTVTAFDELTGQILYKIPGVGNAQNRSNRDYDREMQKSFEAEINRSIERLQNGESWGTVWNRVKTMYPEVPNEVIDNLLGLEWRKGGAFERYRAKQNSIKYGLVQ